MVEVSTIRVGGDIGAVRMLKNRKPGGKSGILLEITKVACYEDEFPEILISWCGIFCKRV